MKSYNGYIPVPAFKAFEKELTGMVHGTASITFHVRDGNLSRFELDRHTSHLPEEPAGVGHEST